ncbi:potassium channel family protein [Schaalia hyovaginalis]
MASMAHEDARELASGTLVIGLGRFGSAVAVTLDKLGYEILAIEKNPARVQAFAGRFPLVEADATSMEALEQLGAREFRAAVVGAGSSLESSVLITANLVDMGMPSIWAKAISREHGRILRRIGAHHVIYPEFDAGQRTAHLVGGRMIDYIEMEKDGFAIMKLRPPKEVHGFTVEDLDLRGRYGVNLLGVLRPGTPFEYATSKTRINPEDIIIVSGDARLLEYFANRP